jgi:hypothetical protein
MGAGHSKSHGILSTKTTASHATQLGEVGTKYEVGR